MSATYVPPLFACKMSDFGRFLVTQQVAVTLSIRPGETGRQRLRHHVEAELSRLPLSGRVEKPDEVLTIGIDGGDEIGSRDAELSRQLQVVRARPR